MMQTFKRYILAQQYTPGFVGIWVNPFYFARRGLLEEIGKMAPKMKGRLLDVGCGRKPYQNLFRVDEYVGLEIDTPENRLNKQADFFTMAKHSLLHRKSLTESSVIKYWSMFLHRISF